VQHYFSPVIMEETFVPLRGIKNDLRGRLRCYKQDWTGGFKSGFRYLISLVIIQNLAVHGLK